MVSSFSFAQGVGDAGGASVLLPVRNAEFKTTLEAVFFQASTYRDDLAKSRTMVDPLVAKLLSSHEPESRLIQTCSAPSRHLPALQYVKGACCLQVSPGYWCLAGCCRAAGDAGSIGAGHASCS